MLQHDVLVAQIVEIETDAFAAPIEVDVPARKLVATAGSIDRLEYGHAFLKGKPAIAGDMSSHRNHRTGCLDVRLGNHLDCRCPIDSGFSIGLFRGPGELARREPLGIQRRLQMRKPDTPAIVHGIITIDPLLLRGRHPTDRDLQGIPFGKLHQRSRCERQQKTNPQGQEQVHVGIPAQPCEPMMKFQ